MALRPPPRDVLLRSPVKRMFWNLWFAWQAQHNVVNAFHWQQPELDFNWGSVFGRKLFTVNHPDLIHQVLVTNHHKYHKGQLFQRLFRPGLGESVLTAEDDSWKHRRKMIAPAFHMRALHALDARLQARIDEAVSGLAEQGAQPLNTETWATNLALSMALDALFSGGAGDQTAHLAYHMKRGIDGYGQMSVADVLNFPAWVPRPGRRKAAKHAAEVDEVVYALIDERKEQEEVQATPDLLDLILSARDEETGEGLAREDSRNEVFTFFAAGHDTSANALQWALYILSTRPELQADLAAEVRANPDRKSWDLMNRVVAEILRLYPPIFALIREATEPDEIDGVPVPKGAVITIPTYYYHRRPKYWARPTEFDPDHFLPDAVAARPRHAYIPFGLGPRVCPGKALALQTLTMTLGALLKDFELARADDVEIEPFGKLTLRPSQAVHLTVRPRG